MIDLTICYYQTFIRLACYCFNYRSHQRVHPIVVYKSSSKTTLFISISLSAESKCHTSYTSTVVRLLSCKLCFYYATSADVLNGTNNVAIPSDFAQTLCESISLNVVVSDRYLNNKNFVQF